MVNRAVSDFFPKNFPVKVDTAEIDHGEQIPSAYLLDQFHEKHTDSKFHFIIGTDLV